MRVAALSVLSLRLTAAAEAPATFTVTSSAPEHLISPNLYSIFFETEINFGSEGGLYAELIHNRDFERLGRDKWGGDRADLAGMSAIERAFAPADPEAPGLDPHEPPAIPTDYSPWKPVGRAVLAVENGSAPFATNPHSLLLRGGESDGISNPGYWGLGVRPGVAFNLSLYAQVLSPVLAGGVRFNASVRCADGSTVSSVLVGAGSRCGGRQWCLLNASLPPPARACRGERDGGSFELALTQGATEVRLDGVSLRHADAVDGLFRRDVFEKVRAMRPGFVRSPGGNYLEGHGPRTRWDWKATVGPAAARRGHYNSAWGYWVTDGLGVYELLRLSELLGCASQLSIYTGYSMGAAYVPLNRSARFAADAVDLLEFANGDAAATAWGARRAAMGHAAPFGLRRLEVGNEESDMAGYDAHYRLITDAVWRADPAVHVVASGRWGPSIAGSPCLSGARCDEWDDHYYRTPAAMAALHTTYDRYNRSWPKVFVGEFAANGDKVIGSLRSAVAEALFMIGFERNADVVTASSYAPLLNRMSGTQWSCDLINFNATHLFAHPSYYASAMLAASRRAATLAARQAGGHGTWAAVASSDGHAGRFQEAVTVKLANYNESVLEVTVRPRAGHVPARILATVLTAASPDATNSLDAPEAVAPAPLAVRWDGTSTDFVVPMPAWSVVVAEVAFSFAHVEEDGSAAGTVSAL